VQRYDFSNEEGDIRCFDVFEIRNLKEFTRKDIEEVSKDADVVLWILSAENPWCAITWTLISNMHSDLLQKSLVILNKIDLLDEQQVDVTLSHLEDLSNQRAQGEIHDILTFTAKQGGELLVDQVRDWINSKVENSKERYGALLKLTSLLNDTHHDSEYILKDRKKTLESEQGFLASLEADIDRQRMRQIELYGGMGVNLARAFEDEIENSLDKIYKSANVKNTVVDAFGKGITPLKCERQIVEHISDVYADRMVEDCHHILTECRDHWKKMRHHLEERLGFEHCDFNDQEFKSIIPEVKEKIRKSTRAAVIGMKLRLSLESQWVIRRQRMKMFILIFLSIVTLAGVFGANELIFHPWGALGTLGLAGATAIVAIIYALKSRRGINTYMADLMVDKRMQFIEAIREDYQMGITELFHGYAPMFENLRNRIADVSVAVIPLEEEWNEISWELRTTDYDMSHGK